jgi:hypothetical protein
MQLRTSPFASVGLRSHLLRVQGAVFFYPLKPHAYGPSHWGCLGIIVGWVPRFLSRCVGTVHLVISLSWSEVARLVVRRGECVLVMSPSEHEAVRMQWDELTWST